MRRIGASIGFRGSGLFSPDLILGHILGHDFVRLAANQCSFLICDTNMAGCLPSIVYSDGRNASSERPPMPTAR
jgi:hypothetical protein